MSVTANELREIAADLTKRCRAGDFGTSNSLLRARIDAHAVRLWEAATAIDAAVTKAPRSRREIEGESRWHRVRLWLRGVLGLRRGVERVLGAPRVGAPFDKNEAALSHKLAREDIIAQAKACARKIRAGEQDVAERGQPASSAL